MVYTGTEGNPVNRRSLKRQRSIRSKETQWKSVASGGQPTQVRIQALEPRAEQIQTVGTENVESYMVYTGTEIAPGRAKFAGYTPIHGDDDVVYWYSFSNHYTKRAFTQP